MASRRKIVTPEEDVEYIIRCGKKTNTFRWYGEEEKGRIKVWNVGRKYYTTFTKEYFSHLLKHCLKAKRPAPMGDVPQTYSEAKALRLAEIEKMKEQRRKEEELEKKLNSLTVPTEEERTFAEKALEDLKNFSAQDKYYISMVFPKGKHVQDLITQFTLFLDGKLTERQAGPLFGRYVDVVNKKNQHLSDLGGCK